MLQEGGLIGSPDYEIPKLAPYTIFTKMMLNKVKYIVQLPWEQSTFLSAASKRISVEPQTTAQNGPPVVPDSFGNLRKRVDARYS